MGISSSRQRKLGEITEADRAVLSLKTQRRKLEKQSIRIAELIVREREVAKALVASKNKERALVVLRRRVLHQHTLDMLDAWQLNVEQLLSNMEAIKQQGLVFAALKSGNAAASQMQKDVTVADVEALLQNSAAAQAKQQEIQELLASSMTPEQEAAATAELAEFEKMQDDAEVLQLPSVPSNRPVQKMKLAGQADAAEMEADLSATTIEDEPQEAERSLEEPMLAQ